MTDYFYNEKNRDLLIAFYSWINGECKGEEQEVVTAFLKEMKQKRIDEVLEKIDDDDHDLLREEFGRQYY